MNNTVAHHTGRYLIYRKLMGKNYNITLFNFIAMFSSNNL